MDDFFLSDAVTISGRYLILPISPEATRRFITISDETGPIGEFGAFLDFENPRFRMYYPVDRYFGKIVTFRVEPALSVDFTFTDILPKPTAEEAPYRPFLHFTTAYGWINDPNGMTYHNGLYHLYYQHNSGGILMDSENTSWGHAVSEDMIGWREVGDALFPDHRGSCYSGGAVSDTRNVSGFGKDGKPPLLLYYTAAARRVGISKGQKFVQCLLYSTDDGKTVQPYEENPIIPHIEAANRDPKVIWCEEIRAYLLVLYLDRSDFVFFRSDDLVHWTEHQRFTLPEDKECPNLMPLRIEGSDEHRWVFIGAADRYVVGNFNSGMYEIEAGPYRYHYTGGGSCYSYASQCFDNLGGRQVRMAWQHLPVPDCCFRSQLTVPCELSLFPLNGELRLRSLPVAELDAYRTATDCYTFTATEKETFSIPLEKAAYDLTLSVTDGDSDITLSLFGLTVTLAIRDNKLRYNNAEIPLRHSEDVPTLRLLSDVCSAELFADNGLVYGTTYHIADYTQNTLTVTASNSSMTLSVSKLKAVDMYQPPVFTET